MLQSEQLLPNLMEKWKVEHSKIDM